MYVSGIGRTMLPGFKGGGYCELRFTESKGSESERLTESCVGGLNREVSRGRPIDGGGKSGGRGGQISRACIANSKDSVLVLSVDMF